MTLIPRNHVYYCALVAAATLLLCVWGASETPISTTMSAVYEAPQHNLANDVNNDDESRGLQETGKKLYEIGGMILGKAKSTAAYRLFKVSGLDVADKTSNLIDIPLPLETTHLFTEYQHRSTTISSIKQDLYDAICSPKLIAAPPTQEYYPAVIKELAKKYRDRELATILAPERMSDNPNIKKDIVAQVQLVEMELLKWWSKTKSLNDVYELLGLDLTNSAELRNPTLQTWMEYIDLSKGDPVKKLTGKILSENEGSIIFLARMIGMGKLEPKAPDADAIEKYLFTQWRSKKRSVSQVFVALKLNTKVHDVFDKPEFSVWLSYALDLKENPWAALYEVFCDETSRIRTAMYIHQGMSHIPASKYRDAMEEAQFRFWHEAVDVHDMLSQGRGVLENDSLEREIWERYSEYLRKRISAG